MQLTEHFSLAELTVTTSHFPNMPFPAQIDALKALCYNVLEPIRSHYDLPVIITSGFRSPEVNHAAGGAADSQHLNGEAADIHIPGVKNADLWTYIKNFLTFDQVIAERLKEDDGAAGWVHVSFRVNRARMSALSSPTKGVYLGGLHFA